MIAPTRCPDRAGGQQPFMLPRRDFRGVRLMEEWNVAEFIVELIERLLEHVCCRLGVEHGKAAHSDALGRFNLAADGRRGDRFLIFSAIDL